MGFDGTSKAIQEGDNSGSDKMDGVRVQVEVMGAEVVLMG